MKVKLGLEMLKQVIIEKFLRIFHMVFWVKTVLGTHSFLNIDLQKNFKNLQS